VFAASDIDVVASNSEAHVERLFEDLGIVRNGGTIIASIENASRAGIYRGARLTGAVI
jgi:3-methyladenine DNA glycosylase Tag